jgi:hypothetical protein
MEQLEAIFVCPSILVLSDQFVRFLIHHFHFWVRFGWLHSMWCICIMHAYVCTVLLLDKPKFYFVLILIITWLPCLVLWLYLTWIDNNAFTQIAINLSFFVRRCSLKAFQISLEILSSIINFIINKKTKKLIVSYA